MNPKSHPDEYYLTSHTHPSSFMNPKSHPRCSPCPPSATVPSLLTSVATVTLTRRPQPPSYTVHHIVGDLVALLDALKIDRVFLVGHDWGLVSLLLLVALLGIGIWADFVSPTVCIFCIGVYLLSKSFENIEFSPGVLKMNQLTRLNSSRFDMHLSYLLISCGRGIMTYTALMSIIVIPSLSKTPDLGGRVADVQYVGSPTRFRFNTQADVIEG